MRQRHPRLGTRKLLSRLRLRRQGQPIGRDRLFGLLRQHHLLVKPKRRRRPRTTWAGHWRGENLLAGTTLTGPHQAYVSDITFIDTERGFTYLTLITDAYSRYIVGYAVSDTLATAGSLQALNRALAQRPIGGGPFIHHSDRGTQFTDRRYRARLARSGGHSSMGARGDCYDNALAERMNGILKLEYGLDSRFRSIDQARRAVRESVWLYNHERPHLALNYRTPAEVHRLA
jgi:putative transposase